MQYTEVCRKNMIDAQVKTNKVTCPALLAAMSRLPRERFVPRHLQDIAYIDEDIALGNRRYLPEPMVLARLIQSAGVGKDDLVMDIGCGTGYSTAVLGCLASTVVGIEQDKTMVEEADRLLHELDICNAVVVSQPNLRAGYAQQGPYNVILINGSVPEVPTDITNQLSDGGRLVAVLSEKGHMGTAVLITRTGDTVSTKPLFDAAVPLLAGFEPQKSFVF